MYSVALQHVTDGNMVMPSYQWGYHFNFFLIPAISFQLVIMSKWPFELA
jgi:hypothetical protein